MFGLLKRKKPREQEAQSLYEHIHAQSRQAFFYEELSVPDTMEGRFDVLALHLFMVMRRLNECKGGDVLSQTLFDTAFGEIDRGYREIGVGDMGLPKRMKKLMLGFNGAMHAYEQAIGDDAAMKEALRRNVFTQHVGEEEELSKPIDGLLAYMKANIEYLQSQDETSMMNGEVNFKMINEI